MNARKMPRHPFSHLYSFGFNVVDFSLLKGAGAAVAF
jgi:hypothetical protein